MLGARARTREQPGERGQISDCARAVRPAVRSDLLRLLAREEEEDVLEGGLGHAEVLDAQARPALDERAEERADPDVGARHDEAHGARGRVLGLQPGAELPEERREGEAAGGEVDVGGEADLEKASTWAAKRAAKKASR